MFCSRSLLVRSSHLQYSTRIFSSSPKCPISVSENRSKKRRNKRLGFLAATALVGTGIYLINKELNENGTWGPKFSAALQKLPTRSLSAVWGYITSIELPTPINQWVIKTYAQTFNCNLDEMAEPIESFKSLQDFFCRRLKEGAREFIQDGIASPSDGVIMSIHEVTDPKHHVDQVKGIPYALSEFLGEQIPRSVLENEMPGNNRLYHCIIYLAPGDYHGFHAPVEWDIIKRRYFPGHLFPVAPLVAQRLQNLLGLNERVILAGNWEHGYFAFSAVGATNVGSISLVTEPEFRSNLRGLPLGKEVLKEYEDPIRKLRGDLLGFFHLGSTVVLAFESPPLEFDVSPGMKVKMGDRLAHYV